MRRELPRSTRSAFRNVVLAQSEVVTDNNGTLWVGDGTTAGGNPQYRRGVSVWHFAEGANLASPSVNALPAFDAAVAWCKAKGIRSIFIPAVGPQGYRLDGGWRVGTSLDVYGEGTTAYNGTAGGTRGGGSWLFFNHHGTGVEAYGDDDGERCGSFTGLGAYRSHPEFGPGWTPNDDDFDWAFLKGWWKIDDIFSWNCARYLRHDYAGAGRITAGHLAANAYKVGLYVDRCADIGLVQSLRIFPFKSADTNVVQYTYANLDGMVFRKVDGFFIDQYFGIFCHRHMLLTGGAGSGIPTRINIGSLYADLYGETAIVADNTADGASFKVGMLDAQGGIAADSNPGGAYAAIAIAGDSVYGEIGGGLIDRVNQQAAIITGANSKLVFSSAPRITDFNRSNINATAYAVTDSSSRMFIGDGPVPYSTTGAPPVSDPALISSPYWKGQTPLAATPDTGTIGALGPNGMQQMRRGELAELQARVAVTSAGTGAGWISLTVMLGTGNGDAYPITGFDTGANKAIEGYVQGATLKYRHADGSYAGQTGADVNIYATYKTNI